MTGPRLGTETREGEVTAMGFKVVQVLEVEGSQVPDYGQMIRLAGFEVEFVKLHCNTEDEIIAAAQDADAVIGTATFQPFTRRVMEHLARCRFIISMGTGFETLDVEAATDHGILAANVPDFCFEEVSDHAMALILACTRRTVQLDRLVHEGKWKEEAAPDIQQAVWPKMSRLKGQMLGLVGFGRIAQALVPKARGFGMMIISHDPYVPPDVFESMDVETVELDELLAQADIVSLHIPLTRETEHLIGLEQLRKMKPTAYLVNTARGSIVDQSALYTALSEDHIAGAALDVTDPAPISPDDSLLGLDNVIITPHSAGISPLSLSELMRRPGEEIIKVLRGQWPAGLLNPEAKEAYRRKWG